MPSYRAMFRNLIDVMAPRPGEAILEIGCGAGSLVRLLARRLGTANPITAADVNPFLLREAAAIGGSGRTRRLDPIPPRQRRGAAVRGRFVRLRLFGHGLRRMRRRPGDRRGDAGRPARRPGRARRAGARHAAMVEPGAARGDPPQGRDAAPFGGSRGCRRPQPLSADARGRVCRSRVFSVDGDARPPGRPDLAQPRGPHPVAAVGRTSWLSGTPSAIGPRPRVCCSWPTRCIAPSAPNLRRSDASGRISPSPPRPAARRVAPPRPTSGAGRRFRRRTWSGSRRRKRRGRRRRARS